MYAPLHSALRSDGGRFRLLQLQPGRDGDPLSAALLPVSLTDRHSYEALSYVWGPPENQGSILVDGETLAIRATLLTFLVALRRADTSRLVYADAICINQIDDLEKGHQVQMMGEIYQNATKVLAWLGPGSLKTTLLFDVAKRVSADDYGSPADGEIQGSWRRDISLAAEMASLRSTLDEVMERDYWKRAWIVQECLLAKEVVFCLGDAVVTWDQFLLVHMMLLNKPPVARRYTWARLISGFTRFDHLAGERANIDDYPQSLAHIVNKFHTTESTVPHDMIYAFFRLLRVSRPDHPGRLMVDYGMPTSSLYLRAGYAYLVDPGTAMPHRVLPTLLHMLKLTSLEAFHAVLALIDPEELLSPVDWIVGAWDPAETPAGRTFRKERKWEGLAYMDCHVADFTTLVRLLDARENRHSSG